ncbi:MAG: glycosyltransferase family 39 protein, partial [Tepidisphaeraceae bacterium]
MARRIILAALLIVAALVFTAGINWGLPSRRTDKFLRAGLRVEGLTSRVPQVDASRGADVTAAIGPPDQIVAENDTDEKRAQILCRYRLYSYQPDEMITFRSLSQMKPGKGDLDPRLYQYGGLWIYGIAAIVEVGGHLTWLDITNRDTYIGDPELFGKLYVAARAYSAVLGLLGVWAVFAIVHRWTKGSTCMAAVAGLCFIFMPVVVVMAHEAKPHLGGASLILLAVLAAHHFVETKKSQWAWAAGALCGAAAGMVLWGVAGWIILPVMALLVRRRDAAWRGLIAAAGVYAITNPYVIYHLLFSPGALWSNLGNTSAMYGVGRPDLAIVNAAQLTIAGAGPIIFAVGLVGGFCWIRKAPSSLCMLLGSAA